MMAEVESVDGSETLSSGDSESARHSLDFKDPLGVNDQYHLCAAVDDESDEFDFDVSLPSIDVCCLQAYLSPKISAVYGTVM